MLTMQESLFELCQTQPTSSKKKRSKSKDSKQQKTGCLCCFTAIWLANESRFYSSESRKIPDASYTSRNFHSTTTSLPTPGWLATYGRNGSGNWTKSLWKRKGKCWMGLQAITIKLLPANTASVLQACNMGSFEHSKATFAMNSTSASLTQSTTMKRSLLPTKWSREFIFLMQWECWTRLGRKSPRRLLKTVGIKQVLFFTTITSQLMNRMMVHQRNNWNKSHCHLEWHNRYSTNGLTLTMTLFTHELTKEEIMNELIEGMANDQPDEDENVQDDYEEAVKPPVTAAEMQSALSTLERGLQQTNFSDLEDFENMQKVVKNHLRDIFSQKQTTLNKFFSTKLKHSSYKMWKCWSLVVLTINNWEKWVSSFWNMVQVNAVQKSNSTSSDLVVFTIQLAFRGWIGLHQFHHPAAYISHFGPVRGGWHNRILLYTRRTLDKSFQNGDQGWPSEASPAILLRSLPWRINVCATNELKTSIPMSL